MPLRVAAISLVMPGIGVWPALRSVRPVSADLNTVFSAEPKPGPITHTRATRVDVTGATSTRLPSCRFWHGTGRLANGPPPTLA